MEIFNKLCKNGSTKRITTWTFIYLLYFQFPGVICEETFSSGMDDTTTYTESSTSTFISLTPFLSTRPTTSSPINETISTESSDTTVFIATLTTTSLAVTVPSTAVTEPTTIVTELTTTVTQASTTAAPTCEQQKEFIAYGTSTGDTTFPRGDDNFIVICPSIEVPIDSKSFGCFYLSSNGYITNGNLLPFSPSESEVNTQQITLMPLWTDIDVSTVGNIYYQIVDIYDTTYTAQSETNRAAIKNLFSTYGYTTFNPIWALKITWDNVVPYERDSDSETMTFQFILASDGTVTNMAYIYDDCKSSWLSSRSAIMGYVYPTFSYYHRDSLTEDIFKLGSTGNTQMGTEGVWIFQLSKTYTTNYAKKCLDWSLTASKPVFPWYLFTVSCPCTRWQARRDFRFTRGPQGCFYLTFPSFGYSKVCCYARRGRPRSLMRGNLQFNSVIFSRRQWRIDDRLPYKYCCLKSNYCDIYDEYRPRDYCDSYTPPIRRFAFGDPHIQTLDGYSYIFNGKGEFELLNIYNATGSSTPILKIQCRTKEVGTSGNKATVFSGFALQSDGVKFQIDTRSSATNVEIFGDDVELTKFYTDDSYTWSKGPFYVAHSDGVDNSYIIRHTSQTIMEISLEQKILQFSLNVGYNLTEINTDGLLGNYNNDVTDDLKTPTGAFIPINSTEEDIYYNFGLLWKVNQSIFHYENGETEADYNFANFTPTFLKIDKSSAEYKKAVDICTGEKTECIYDYLITKDEGIAGATKEVESQIGFNMLLAAVTSPVFNGSREVTANVNEKLVHIVEVTGDNGTLELEVIENQNCNISYANKEVQISIELNSVIPVTASFQVSNSYNMSTSLFNLTVMICPLCQNQGKCDNTSVSPTNSNEYLCKCPKGWRGPYCEVDARCDPLGCPCTGTALNYTCDCPDGYIFRNKCVDIDECKNTTNPPCSQNCKNTLGSYKCSCNDGYTLVNKTECIDVDECALRLNQCDQLCNNTKGSYKCECYPGYVLNGTTTCTEDNDVCNGTSSINCTRAAGCTLDENSKPYCFCNPGYTFNDTAEMCQDINECDSITCINGKCENSVGSYSCKCPIGTKLGSDGRTCEECGLNKWGMNCANTCYGGNCITCNKTIGCICKSGYKGANCTEDIDECQNPNYCNNTISSCVNTIGSAICQCNDGFILDTAKGECVDIDECLTEDNCSDSATCTNTFGNYTCKCNDGYAGDGFNCTDINECAAKSDKCDQNCLNQVGSYSCTCKSKYKLLDDRYTCERVKDPCINITCIGGTCESSNDNYVCKCPDHKKLADDGLTCEDKFEIHENRLYYIIIGSLAGAVILGLIISLWCYCFGCACCGCCKRRRNTYLSTIDPDRLHLAQAFGSVSSTLTGKLRDDPLTDSARAARYLEDWGHFSPYSENNKRGFGGADNLGWEDFGESSSSWGNVFDHLDNSAEFRIERPKFRP